MCDGVRCDKKCQNVDSTRAIMVDSTWAIMVDSTCVSMVDYTWAIMVDSMMVSIIASIITSMMANKTASIMATSLQVYLLDARWLTSRLTSFAVMLRSLQLSMTRVASTLTTTRSAAEHSASLLRRRSA